MQINANELEFQTTLVLSTAHITKSDSYMLSGEAAAQRKGLPAEVFIVNEFLEGFGVYVPACKECLSELTETADRCQYSGSMTNLIRLVEDLRDTGQPVHYLKLDRDGPIVKQLPHHDW